MKAPLSTRLPSRRILFIGGAIVTLTVAGSLYAVSRIDAPKMETAVVYELAADDVLTVQPKPMSRTLRLSGTLSPLRHAVIKSHSSGALIQVRVQEGDRVHAGTLLAQIDPRNLQAEFDARVASLHKAQADLLLASKNRDNSTVLLNQKLISQNAFDQTEAAYGAAAANEDAAQAQVRLARIALEDTEIRAEFAGVVAARHVQVGERVMPDAPLLTLVDLGTMQLEALVPVADVPAIKVGQQARFTVDGFGVREFTGHLERINPQTQQGTRSLSVYLTLTNTDGALKGGMFADGTLLLEQTDAHIAVPSNAIHRDDNGDYVLALSGGVVTRAAVTIGEAYADAGVTVITTGLPPATQVIVAPATTLKPGTKAKLTAST